MKAFLNKPIVKSFIRGLLIAFNAVYAATQTYAAQGNSIGLNLATVVGVAWTLAGVGVALAQRYFDTTDPAFGRFVDLVANQAQKVITQETSKTTKVSKTTKSNAPPVAP